MDDLDHHLAGRDRLDDGGADRLLAHALDEAADDLKGDVGFQQRAAHLAHRGVDVLLGQRAASRQPIENATKLFRQIVEQCRCPFGLCGASLHSPPVISRSQCAIAHKAGDDDLVCPGSCQDDRPNTFAPEGASRCRALTSGLKKGPVGGSKRASFRESGGVKPLEPRKVKEKSSRMTSGAFVSQ